MNIFAIITVIVISIIFIVLLEIFTRNTKFGNFIKSSKPHAFFIPLFVGILLIYLLDISVQKSIDKYGVKEEIEVVNRSLFKCEQNIKIEKIKLVPKETTWFLKIFWDNKSFIESYYQITNVEN